MPTCYNGETITYTVVETPISKYTAQYGGSASNAEDQKGRITFTGNTAAVTITNKQTIPTGSLTIVLTVVGDEDSKKRPFAFEVTIGTDGSREYRYGGSSSGTVTGGTKTTIYLSHEQHITFAQLPEGTAYTVAEKDANTDGFITTCSGANENGTISAGMDSRIVYLNTKIEVPKTGDASLPTLWFGILVLSGAGLVGSVIVGRRKRRGNP